MATDSKILMDNKATYTKGYPSQAWLMAFLSEYGYLGFGVMPLTCYESTGRLAVFGNALNKEKIYSSLADDLTSCGLSVSHDSHFLTIKKKAS